MYIEKISLEKQISTISPTPSLLRRWRGRLEVFDGEFGKRDEASEGIQCVYIYLRDDELASCLLYV